MIIDSDEYIKTNITKYLENVLQLIGYKHISIEYQPVILYVLSCALLQMTGFLEKKIDMISWHIAHIDFDYRYNLIRTSNTITPDINKLNQIYNYLMGTKGKKIMQEVTFYNNAYSKIFDLFNNTCVINYTNSEFLEFKNNYSRCISSDELDILYKKTLDYRHNIAHNINSVYKDHINLSQLSIKEEMYTNNYARFMILVLVDLILINKFQEYIKNNSTIKFLN